MAFIDTHSHIFFDPLGSQIPKVVKKLRDTGCTHSIQVATNLKNAKEVLELSKKYDLFYPTAGFHPLEVLNYDPENLGKDMKKLEKFIGKHSEIVAVGEMGLDNHHVSEDEEIRKKQLATQHQYFEAQAKLSMKLDLPAIVHSRKYPDETFEAIEKIGMKKFVIHCFSENLGFANQIFEYSTEAMISFTGLVTYENVLSVREVAAKAPLERIMIETDAPYLVPDQVDRTRQAPSDPSMSRFVLKSIQELRPEDPEVIEKTIYENSLRFFNLPST